VARALEAWHLQRDNSKLTKRLEETIEELRRLNEGLESEVARRIGDLEFQNRVLRRSQELLDQLPVAVVGVDIEGVVVQCNREVETLFGIRGGELINHPAASALPGEAASFLVDGQSGGKVKVGGSHLSCLSRVLKGEDGAEVGRVLVAYKMEGE